MRKRLAKGRAEVRCEKRGLRHSKNLFLLVALVSGLGLVLTSRVTAQTFRNLHSFTALDPPFSSNSDGANPFATLVLSGNRLYGTARDGGPSGLGTVFAVNTDGTGFTRLPSFGDGMHFGAHPSAGLILSNDILYGTTPEGGSNFDFGTIYAINTDGTGFTTLHFFTGGNDGAYPSAGLILSGNSLYGTAVGSGTSGYGTVFAINTNGTGFTVLYNLSDSDGGDPQGVFILSGNTLYGTTLSGNGTVFAVNTNGTVFTTLHSFTDSGDGAFPSAGLILSRNTLYGTTSGGNGTVFAVNIDGTTFTNLYSFTGGSDGASPNGGLTLAGNSLYGTTSGGGDSYNGTVFKLNTDGTGFTTLYNFSGGSDGANPQAALISTANTFYGTTSAGGSGGVGTVFSLSLGPVSPPQLAIVSAGTNVILTWTNTASAHTLQSATNLVSSVWTTNSPTLVVVNGQLMVTNPISGSQQFFRLSQ
jgi:uncharacterized repeat protein (TIGR03803 family)